MSEENDDATKSGGYSLPKFKKWNPKNLYDFDQHIVDYENVEQLETALGDLRKALFRVNNKINEYERSEKIAKKAYEREHRRQYLASTEKTEAAKKTRADLACEDLENEWLTYEQLRIELTRFSFVMKSELESLHVLSHNLRAQMKL